MDKSLQWLPANWPAPAHVKAGCTTRLGGVSDAPYTGFNLAEHVGDKPAHVAANRQQLTQLLDLPSTPRWLQQVHGCQVYTDAQVLQQAD